MNKVVKVLGVGLLVMLVGNGCLSYMVMKSSETRIAKRRAVAANDQAAIKAIDAGAGAAAIGIDISNLDKLTEQPLLQFFAAVFDSATLYFGGKGVAKLVDDANGKNDKQIEVNVAGTGNNTTVITGDNNSRNGSQDNSEEEVAK